MLLCVAVLSVCACTCYCVVVCLMCVPARAAAQCCANRSAILCFQLCTSASVRCLVLCIWSIALCSFAKVHLKGASPISPAGSKLACCMPAQVKVLRRGLDTLFDPYIHLNMGARQSAPGRNSCLHCRDDRDRRIESSGCCRYVESKVLFCETL